MREIMNYKNDRSAKLEIVYQINQMKFSLDKREVEYRQKNKIPEDQPLDFYDRLCVATRVARDSCLGHAENENFRFSMGTLVFGYVFDPNGDWKEYIPKERHFEAEKNIITGLLPLAHKSAVKNAEETDKTIREAIKKLKPGITFLAFLYEETFKPEYRPEEMN